VGHRRLTVELATDVLRRTRPKDPARRAVRRVTVELVAELRRLERRISSTDADIAAAVEATGSTLSDLYDIGQVLAAKIVARVGPVNRAIRPHHPRRVHRPPPDLQPPPRHRVLSEYTRRYDSYRPHQALDQRAPNDEHRSAAITIDGLIRGHRVLGGVISEYHPAA
jgi:hypothetical protein